MALEVVSDRCQGHFEVRVVDPALNSIEVVEGSAEPEFAELHAVTILFFESGQVTREVGREVGPPLDLRNLEAVVLVVVFQLIDEAVVVGVCEAGQIIPLRCDQSC